MNNPLLIPIHGLFTFINVLVCFFGGGLHTENYLLTILSPLTKLFSVFLEGNQDSPTSQI